ncbi:MAG TPA: ABC transporter permease [bacterium]|nr:ABC transporter permease [bacterium]
MWAIFRKEMVETLRDRRTLIIALLLPVVLMPLVTLGVPYLASRQRQQRETAVSHIAVTGAATAPALVSAVTGQGHIEVVPVLDAGPSLQRGQVDAILEIQHGFRTRLAAGDAQVTVFFDESEPRSVMAYERVAQGVATYSATLTIQHLVARGISRRDLTPIQIVSRSVADRRRLGGALLAGLLPFFIAIWASLGGQHTALDVGAGERERRTLDALLLTPPSRTAVATGKFLAVLVTSLGAVVMVIAASLASLRVGGALGIADLARTSVSLSLGSTVWLVVVSTFLVGFLSASQLALSLLARSMREAQQFLTPLYLGATLPAMVAPFLEGWERSAWTYLIPSLGPIFALRGLLMGSLTPAHLTLALASAALCGATALAVAVWAVVGEQTAGG